MPNKDTIDERVVEMRIDNRQFVKGANNTISVLDKLKAALSFKDAAKGFNEIDKAANKVGLGGISSAVDTIANKFTVFGRMGQRVIENLTDSIYNFTKKTIKELTTDQIQAGWKKYEDITTSIHTIMGATANNWEQTLERISKDYGFVGTQMDYVSQQMEKLNWFSDETSASLTDMVNNIGKFTNAGVELDQATISMMGISTWGYKSGASVNEISRAMYNLSQAMALGEVRLMDWRSIENANMATIEFKQTVLDTAVDIGTLTKSADGLYKTLNGKDVSATNFNENLSEGWFTSDVLQATLYQYGHFANLMQQVTDMTDVSTRDMLDMVEDYKNGAFDAVKWQNRLYQTMGSNTPSIYALNTAMETLGKSEDELGWKAFLASQETKTLTEAIEYTKDAVSSGWMKTWEYVFGDYEEAKEFWGDVTDELYELFVKAGERRNAILSFWKEDGGRDALIESLWNVYDAIMNFVQPIKDAFKTIFGLDDDPKKAAKVILDLTYRFRDFTETLFANEDTLKGMRVVFTKLFSGIKVGLTYLQKAFSVLSKVFGYVTRVIGAFFRAFSSGTFDSNKFLGEMNDIFGDIIKNINTAWEKVKKFIEGLYDIPVLGPILKILVAIFEKIGDASQWVVGQLKDVKVTGEGLKGPFKVLNDIFEGILGLIKGINIDSNKLSSTFNKVSDIFSTMWEGLVGDPNEFKAKVKNVFKLLWESMKEEAKKIKFSDLMQGAKTGILVYIAAQFANIATSFNQATKSLKSIPEAISGVFSSIQDTFKALQKSINANTYIKIAVAIGILAWAILQLSKIDDNKLVLIAASLVIMFALLAKAAKSLEGTNMFSGNNSKVGVMVKNISKTAQMLIGLGVVIAAAAYAMWQISSLNDKQITQGLKVIITIIGVAMLAMYLLNKAVNDEQGNMKSFLKLASFAAIIKAVGDAMVKLAGMDTSNIMIAALSMATVIAALAFALSQASKIQTNALGMMGVIVALTIAIIALIAPLVILAKVAQSNSTALIVAAGIIGLLVMIMAGFMKLGAQIGDMPGFRKFAVTLVILASAMLIFAIATAVMVPAIIALIAAFAGLVAVIMAMTDEQFELMTDRLTKLGLSLLPLAAVLLIVGAGLLMFGAGLLAAAIAVGVFSLSILGFAASIALIALAVDLFVNAVINIVKASAEYGDQFLQVIQGLLLAVLGMLVGYRLYIANVTLTIILTILSVLVSVGGDKLIEAISFLLLKVAQFLVTITSQLADLIVGFIVYLLNAVTSSLQKNKEALIIAIERLVGTIISLVLEVAIRLIFDAIDTLFNWIASLFGGENTNAPFSEWGKQIADSLSEGVMDGFEHTYRIAEAGGENTGGTMVTMAQEAAEAKAPDFSSALSGIMSDGIGTANNTVSSESPVVGQNLITGMNNGMIDEYYSLMQPNIGELGNQIIGDMSAALGEHSPSKFTEQMGRYWDLGLAFGIRDNASEISDANDEVANQMNDALLSTMQMVGMIANEDMAIRPLIKPVVDLSDVSSASSMVSGMFGTYGSMDIGAINARVREAADNASSVASDVNAFGEASGVSGDSYTINVYSQPGMDENELANAVMYKIQNGIVRKGAALG